MSFFFPLRAAAPPDIKFHLQRLDVLEFVGVPLFDLLIFPRCEEQMSLGDELEEHDAAGRRERGDVKPRKTKRRSGSIKGEKWKRRDERAAGGGHGAAGGRRVGGGKEKTHSPQLRGGSARLWRPLPVVVSEHGAVAVAKVQTPDLHVSVGRAGSNNCTVLSIRTHIESAEDQHSGLGGELRQKG